MDMLLLDRMRVSMRTTKAVFGILPIALGLVVGEAFGLLTATVDAQIFVLFTPPGTNNNSVIAEYTTSGEAESVSLIANTSNEWPGALGYGGDGHLFVVNAGGVGEYSTSGAPVNSSLISGLDSARCLVVDNAQLFLWYSPEPEGHFAIGEYTTSGTPVNAALIYPLSDPGDIKSDGNGHLFLLLDDSLLEYTTSGVALYLPLIDFSPSYATAFAADGNGYLYVATGTSSANGNNWTNNGIAKYTTSGVVVDGSLSSGLAANDYVVDMALDGSGNLFVLLYADSGGTVAEYTTSGQVVNPSLISGLQGSLYSIIVVPPLQPPQGPQPTVSLIKAVKPSFSNLYLGTNYQLQVSTDLSNWTNSGSAFAATNAVMDYSQYFDVDKWGELFFRLQTSP